MAQNSFALKAWAVTIIAAVFALAAKDSNPKISLVAYLPALTFWMLDAYYLRQERLFQRLFDVARVAHPPAGDTTDYSMDLRQAVGTAPADVKKRLTYLSSLGSVAQAGLYIPLLIAITLVAWAIGAFRALWICGAQP